MDLKDVLNIISKSKIEDFKAGEKTTIVLLTLPNGYELLESSACVDPKNYDHNVGKRICLDRLQNKIFMLEGYLEQNEKYLSSKTAKIIDR